ncbi:MAG: hypothetical protein ACI4S9_05110, partial [Christensenellales bacterium]
RSADWNTQVTSAVNSDNLPDVFHWNLEANSFPTLKRWAVGGSLKALPDDLSAYPNIEKMLDSVTGKENMKINGKLYCLPLIRNVNDTVSEYSEFTYVYRKDWARRLAEKNPEKYGYLYKEDDVYTFGEFEALLKAFKDEDMAGNKKTIPLADVEWSYPSVINYFKKAPHCYYYDETAGKYVWNYTTAEFTEGLEKAKSFVEKGYYWADQYTAKEGDAASKYKSGVVGCYFENCSLKNYWELRKSFKANNPSVDTDEGTAIMRLMNDEGRFVYEGANNWWSATLFSADISDEKMAKMLEVMDWLISEEGTLFCAYGFEGTDYVIDEDGKLELFWNKKTNGEYATKRIGARYLRYAVTLGYDIMRIDPLIDDKTKAAYTEWYDDVQNQIANDEVYIMPLYLDMNWQSSEKKDEYAGLLNDAIAAIVTYTFGDGGWTEFNQNSRQKYEAVLGEINR